MPAVKGCGGRQRFAAQDQVFAALERLESKETQYAAWEELQRLVRDLEAANLSTLLHAVSHVNSKTTQFARVHSLRLAALCTQQGRCLAWRAMLAPPLLPKLLGLLARALHDADSAFRIAASECFGLVAAAQASIAPLDGSNFTAGASSNPVLACILDALGEPGGAVQAAAATALAECADHLRPGLDPALLHQLLRALSNPLFLGRTELCGALARLEEGHVHGLLASSCQQLLGAWPELLGNVQDGTGLLGALGSKGKDFSVRAAAAHALRALAVGAGPLAPAAWEAVVAALKTAKTDVSKPVRDASAAALPVVAGLQAFLAAGSPAQAWPEVCGSLLAASEGGRSRRPPGGGSGKPKPGVAGKPGGMEEASDGQRIPAVWPVGAQQGGMPAVPMAPSPEHAPQAAAMQSPAVPVSAMAATVFPRGGMLYASPGTGVLAAAPLPPAAFPADPNGAASQQLAAQLAAIQDQQAHMAAALSAFTMSTQGTLRQMQQHLASVSCGVSVLASSGAAGTAGAGGQQQQQHSSQLQQDLASVHAGLSTLALGVGGLQTPATGSQAVPSGQPTPVQQLGGTANRCPKRLSSLNRSYNALDQQLHPRQARKGSHSFLGTPPAVAKAANSRGSPAGGSGSPAASAAGYESSYAQLLGSWGVDGEKERELRLLRCMQKSGVVWEHLAPSTAERLMAAIVELLQEGAPLKRLLPWLWPLADYTSPASAVAAAIPYTLRHQLIAALAAYPLPAAAAGEQQQDEGAGGALAAGLGAAEAAAVAAAWASAMSEKRDLLVSALRAVWDH